MNTDNVRTHVVLDLLRTKHSLGGVGVAAHALIAVRGTADPAHELALLLDTALDMTSAAMEASAGVDAYLDRLTTELEFKEIADGFTAGPDETPGGQT